MRDLYSPGKQDDFYQLTSHLLNASTPINYSLEYLLENYGDRAIPALIQALPVRPWFERQIIMEALGKLGDIRAIVPVCALLYEETKNAGQLASSVIYTLRNLVYYCHDRKAAINILFDLILRYRQCSTALTAVLKEQRDKYTLKMTYKILFKQDSNDLKESAIIVLGDEDGFTDYRIKYLKKMLSRTTDQRLQDKIIAPLKVLISKKCCQRLCSKKGLRFDAFFHQPDKEAYDCCCVDKYNKRVLIPFGGAVISAKKPSVDSCGAVLPSMASSIAAASLKQKK